jgi:hypothetical protein
MIRTRTSHRQPAHLQGQVTRRRLRRVAARACRGYTLQLHSGNDGGLPGGVSSGQAC